MKTIIDKKSVLPNLQAGSAVSLELGCGNRKLRSESIGIDLLDTDSVDVVGDIFDVLAEFPDSSVKLVTSHHFLEHVENVFQLMKEIERILEQDGIIDFTVPHFTNPYFYSDLTHKQFYGLYSFCYIAKNSLFKRKVPNYNKALDLQLLKVDLVFKTDSTFPVRYIVRKSLGLIFNSCSYMKEFYEDTFSSIFSCYEIRYRLKKHTQRTEG